MNREADRTTSKTVCKGNFNGYGSRIGERRQLGAGWGCHLSTGRPERDFGGHLGPQAWGS